jgi:mannose-6-phosphate isomerase
MGGAATQVAALYAANQSVATDDAPYAELWMGTHPSGPSVLAGSSTTLKAAIEAHPALLLGDAVHGRWGAELPMLFKVLSVASALSIQAHPDKVNAAAAQLTVHHQEVWAETDTHACSGVGGEAARRAPARVQGRQPQARDGGSAIRL